MFLTVIFSISTDLSVLIANSTVNRMLIFSKTCGNPSRGSVFKNKKAQFDLVLIKNGILIVLKAQMVCVSTIT